MNSNTKVAWAGMFAVAPPLDLLVFDMKSSQRFLVRNK